MPEENADMVAWDLSPQALGCQTWADLVRWLTVLSEGWVFRGLEDLNYHLVTTLERGLDKGDIPKSSWPKVEGSLIGYFKEQARVVLSEVPDESDPFGWLALMQHYRAPTRLLDWTRSPFVACYFAYVADGDQDRAVWALNAQACRQVYGAVYPFGRDHLGVITEESTDHKTGKVTKSYPGRRNDWVEQQTRLFREAIENGERWPLPLPPLYPDKRMIAQQALFTCDGSLDAPVDHLTVKSEWRFPSLKGAKGRSFSGGMLPPEQPAELIERIRLPGAWRPEALRSLDRMNINSASLFPGLEGVGTATALRIAMGAPLTLSEILDQC